MKKTINFFVPFSKNGMTSQVRKLYDIHKEEEKRVAPPLTAGGALPPPPKGASSRRAAPQKPQLTAEPSHVTCFRADQEEQTKNHIGHHDSSYCVWVVWGIIKEMLLAKLSSVKTICLKKRKKKEQEGLF